MKRLLLVGIAIAGLALTTAGAWQSTRDPEWSGPAISEELALVLSLTGLFGGVTLGAGGIKSNVVVLGADQFRLPEQEAEQASAPRREAHQRQSE